MDVLFPNGTVLSTPDPDVAEQFIKHGAKEVPVKKTPKKTTTKSE